MSSAPSESRSKLIVLNGFPGTGKYTVLKRVADILPPGHARLIDNHLLIDPVIALLPQRNAEHYDLRKAVREPVFAAIRALLERECITILMTACLAEGNETDRGVFEEHLRIVRGLEVDLHWITAHCDREIMEQRLANPSRYREQKTKLGDWQILRAMLDANSLLVPVIGQDAVRVLTHGIDLGGDVDESAREVIRIVD